ncbi:unnamed protein product [Paramecium pentaurelia]|uniref:Transmembrane protein n=1 Tax=Paramecium pentaurelia TaxID=43138 RepID=A0A8S1YCG8_9CILI|nr:unnamed protein product [Paramecium pentaurelia]
MLFNCFNARLLFRVNLILMNWILLEVAIQVNLKLMFNEWIFHLIAQVAQIIMHLTYVSQVYIEFKHNVLLINLNTKFLIQLHVFHTLLLLIKDLAQLAFLTFPYLAQKVQLTLIIMNKLQIEAENKQVYSVLPLISCFQFLYKICEICVDHYLLIGTACKICDASCKTRELNNLISWQILLEFTVFSMFFLNILTLLLVILLALTQIKRQSIVMQLSSNIPPMGQINANFVLLHAQSANIMLIIVQIAFLLLHQVRVYNLNEIAASAIFLLILKHVSNLQVYVKLVNRIKTI